MVGKPLEHQAAGIHTANWKAENFLDVLGVGCERALFCQMNVKRASILFVMFVDFDQTARRPAELLEYLNSYFTNFDRTCAKHEVTKIETVGEEYVCAVGVIPRDIEADEALGHGVILHRLIKAATEILQVQRDAESEEVKLKMGIHTGPVVAGVIGQKLPRFRLFGDTINTAARIMQKGLPGELQFGKATRDCLPPGVSCRFRDNIEMKGKGKVPTWLLGSEESKRRKAPKAPKEAKMAKRVSFAEEHRGSASSSGSRPSLTEVLQSVPVPSLRANGSDSEEEHLELARQLSRTRSRNQRQPRAGSQVIEMSSLSGTSGSSRRSILRRDSEAESSFNSRASEAGAGFHMADCKSPVAKGNDVQRVQVEESSLQDQARLVAEALSAEASDELLVHGSAVAPTIAICGNVVPCAASPSPADGDRGGRGRVPNLATDASVAAVRLAPALLLQLTVLRTCDVFSSKQLDVSSSAIVAVLRRGQEPAWLSWLLGEEACATAAAAVDTAANAAASGSAASSAGATAAGVSSSTCDRAADTVSWDPWKFTFGVAP
ncbi:unnamed protein product [Effrenium voratum]|nr:unnamed protein product [Effrenium voratum]